MKKIHFKTLLWLLIAAGFFLAGYWVNPKGNTGKPVAERSVLYYVDPMNPAFKSDKPGISPSCGMPLEPVYAEKSGGGTDPPASMPPGTIRISSEKQQLIGVKTTMV
jgi:membrane fusion protein, copper/silver efflux system